ncbi:unnamed protein product (macronuclear) [Paramecium tetraurelia]|uniref:Uncharacterized protein n=1 Tax=Paramecium tetraurelia TaxID=5888 RepID=A0CUP6_PARTE|nr:uncharacterized protein GSPATT00010713001 [Paramecium tetraurelia]CAK74513.1 unnamed protein product [Paramecium tetraurelia]|eukprot:XP_001441910.1 hypothetical protein (macronuclear) [Paramecium tetraurelia strain d4-2]
MNLNWMSQAQIVSINQSNEKGDNNYSFVISSDNSKIISGYSQSIKSYSLDANSKQNIDRSVPQKINCLVQIDLNTVSIGCGKKIYLNQLNKSEDLVLGEHEYNITCLSYSQITSLLASGSEDEKIFLWNVNAQKKIAVFEGHRGWINQLSFSPDGQCLASASEDQQIKLWNIEQSEQSNISKGHQKCVNQVAFSKDGLIIASCSADCSIILWDLIEKNFIIMLKEHTADVRCLEFSFSSKWLASGSIDGSICLWDVKFPQETTLYCKINELYLYPDFLCFAPSDCFATISNDRGQKMKQKIVTKIQVWSLDQIDKKDDKKLEIQKYGINPMCLSDRYRDEDYIFQGYDTLVKVHNLSNDQIEILEGHSSKVVIIKSWDYDRQLLSIDNKNNMIIWQKTNNSWKQQSQIQLEPGTVQNDIIDSQYQDQFVSINSNANAIIISNLNQMQKQRPFIDLDIKFWRSYLSNSQQLFITMGDQQITVIDSCSGEIKFKIENPINSDQSIISNDDGFLAILERYSNKIFIVDIFQKIRRCKFRI